MTNEQTLEKLAEAARAIVAEYGPPAHYDEPYRGIWQALDDAIAVVDVAALRAAPTPPKCEQDEIILPDRSPLRAQNAELRARVEKLESDIAAAAKYRHACEAMIREHSEAAAIFQPGGRFHERANLILGHSAVVDGIAWLVAQLDKAEARATAGETDLLLRRFLWVNHGCPVGVLYGDDGEMQCNNRSAHAPIDFTREGLTSLVEVVVACLKSSALASPVGETPAPMAVRDFTTGVRYAPSAVGDLSKCLSCGGAAHVGSCPNVGHARKWTGTGELERTGYIAAGQGVTERIETCERCQMKLSEHLGTYGVGVRGGTSWRCAACQPIEGPSGRLLREEVVRLRKLRLAKQAAETPAPEGT